MGAGAEQAMLGGPGEAGTGGERAGCSCCCWEVWLQGGMEGESARKKGWDFGDKGGVVGEEGAGGDLFICSAVLCPGA